MTNPTTAALATRGPMQWSKNDSVKLISLLAEVVLTKNTARDLMVITSCEAIRHFHNSNDPIHIQAFYEILAEDGNLFRKAAFVKWVKEFSNASFTDANKKFSFNKNPNSVKSNYRDNAEVGEELYAKARLLPFYKIEMAEEKTEQTIYDRYYDNAEKMVKATDSGIKKGLFLKNEVITEILALEMRIAELAKPLTTAVINAQQGEHVDVTETELAA